MGRTGFQRLCAAAVGCALLLTSHPASAATLSLGSLAIGAPSFATTKVTGTLSYTSSSKTTSYSVYVYAYLYRTATATSAPCNTSSTTLTGTSTGGSCGDVQLNGSPTNVFSCSIVANKVSSCSFTNPAPVEACKTYTSGSWNYYWRAYYTNLSSNSAYVNGAVKSFYKACAS